MGIKVIPDPILPGDTIIVEFEDRIQIIRLNEYPKKSDYDLVADWIREQKDPKHLPPAPPNIVAAAQRLQERLGNTNADLSPWMRAILRLE